MSLAPPQTLIDCKRRVCTELSLEPENVAISMGMSGDFEHAVSDAIQPA